MTDEELIARLRSMHWCVTTEANGVGVSDSAVAPEAADRIEALTKERDEAWKRAAHSEKMWGEAEVKLAKAEAGLLDIWAECGCSTARAILAAVSETHKIKGENQDGK